MNIHIKDKKGILFISILFVLLLFSSLNFSGSNPPPGWYIQYTPYGNRPINDIMFLDSLNGWAVTDRVADTAYILKTTDGGNNWIVKSFYLPWNGSRFTRVQMLNSSTGFACGGDGNSMILKTTDGGYNWQNLNLTQGTRFSDMEFKGQDTGWVCDELDGYTYRTTNCGASWQLQNVICNQLSFANSKTGWASNGYLFYKTTNGGETWPLISNNIYIGEMFYVTPTIGSLISSTLNPVFNKTTNGGLNWIGLFTPPNYYGGLRLFFVDENNGWYGNDWYKITIIKNGGMVYGTQITPTIINYNAYFIDTLRGWSGFQSVIHTNDGGGPITGIGNNGQEIAGKYKLYQNYPNPFNPVTTIKFDIPESGNATLKIYDVRGREIKTLFSEHFFAGEYEARFDGSGLTSGVYFYRLSIINESARRGGFSDTKRMLLIK